VGRKRKYSSPRKRVKTAGIDNIHLRGKSWGGKREKGTKRSVRLLVGLDQEGKKPATMHC